MFNKIKNLFKRKPTEKLLQDKDKMLYDHIIALSRLSLIKPEMLVKESKNVKANGEYLYKMIIENEKQK